MLIRFNGHEAKILEGLSPTDVELLAGTLSYIPVGAEFSIYAKKFVSVAGRRVYNKRYREDYDPRVKLFNKRSWTFPTGLLTLVMNLFPDAELQSAALKGFLKKPQLKGLRDYQKDVVNALTGYARGMAEAPTGAGKTMITAELVLRAKKLQVLVTVPSRDLLHQTVSELTELTGESIGVYGDGERTLQRITVATVQSLTEGVSLTKRTKALAFDSPEHADRLKWLEDIEYWIVDECHGAATESYQIVSALMPSAYLRHGLTATLKREDGAELALEGVLGPCRIQISPMELIDKKWLVRPRIELHYLEHKTYREGREKQKYDVLYRLAVTDNPNRNAYIADQVQKCLDLGKKPVLVMFERIDHGKALHQLFKERGFKTDLVTGEDKTKHRLAVKAGAKDGSLDVILASVVWVTGVNIPELQALVVAGCGRSAIQVVQRAGRVLRTAPGKTNALIIDLCDVEESYLGDQSNDRRYHYITKYPGCVEGIEVEGLF